MTRWIMAVLMVTAADARGDESDPAQCPPHNPAEVRSDRSNELTGGLDEMVSDFLAEVGLTPGLSIGVVNREGLVYARGFGYRDLEQCLPATIRTRYYLKSTTKSFLGLAAALLHEEGRVDLDAPVTAALPELVLPEGLNGDQVSLRAHFNHTQPYFDAGLNYRTAFPGNLPESDFVAHANRWSRAKDIGFRYSNFGPIMGAHALSALTGESWQDLIQDRVFEPAGMKDSSTRVSLAERGPVAVSYVADASGRFVSVATKSEPQMHAGGGAFSTVEDLARWIRLNLDPGRIDGAQVFPRRAVEHAQARQVSVDRQFLEFRRFAHGLGIYSADYEGELLMHHFGGETHVSFMPDHDLGLIVLSNNIAQGAAVTHRLAALVYDALLGKADLAQRRDRRLAEINQWSAQREQRLATYLDEGQTPAVTGETLLTPMRLAGHYEDARLGKMSVSFQDAGAPKLAVSFGELSGPLEPLGGNAYLAWFMPWGQPPERFQFRHDESGRLILDWGGRLFAEVSD